MKKIISRIIDFLLPYSDGITVTIKSKNFETEKGVWYQAIIHYKGEKIMVEKI